MASTARRGWGGGGGYSVGGSSALQDQKGWMRRWDVPVVIYDVRRQRFRLERHLIFFSIHVARDRYTTRALSIQRVERISDLLPVLIRHSLTLQHTFEQTFGVLVLILGTGQETFGALFAGDEGVVLVLEVVELGEENIAIRGRIGGDDGLGGGRMK